MINREQIIEVIKTVEDPELYLDIWFLGLIYNIEIDGAKIKIDMTLTSPMCPIGPELVGEVKEKLSAEEGVESVEVNIVFSPRWEPSDEVKATLGIL